MGLGEALSGRYPAQRAVVSEATIADHEIVAAVPGKRIVLLNATIKVANGQTLTWKSGATAISGAMVFATSDLLYHAGDAVVGVVHTEVGEALNLALAAATQVSGHITYAVI